MAEFSIVEQRETSRRKQKPLPGHLGLPVAFKAKKILMNCQTVTNTRRPMLGLQDLQSQWKERSQEAGSTKGQKA